MNSDIIITIDIDELREMLMEAARRGNESDATRDKNFDITVAANVLDKHDIF